MPGVQTLLPILLNEVTKKTISLNEVVKLTSYNPKKIFKIKNKGLIKVGYDADLTIVDMNKTKKVLNKDCLLYTSKRQRDLSTCRMPYSA